MSYVTKRIVAQPDCRGGGAPEVMTCTPRIAKGRPAPRVGYFGRVLRDLREDQNLIYLAARLQNYSEVTDARLASLRQAVDEADAGAIADLAHALTDATAKLGAIRMMKLCIALQMLGRRGLVTQAKGLVAELEHEYARFKENLIYAVG